MYVMQQLGAGVREACRVMFLYVRVKGSAFGGRQSGYIKQRLCRKREKAEGIFSACRVSVL
jgi:hypothetical protein